MTALVRGFTDSYVRRLVDGQIEDLFPHLPAILLDGPKGVGKTRTAQQRARTVRRLDSPAEAEVVSADPTIIRHDEKPVLIDEWHRVPVVWDAVRRLVDESPSGGQFLLTGSPPGPDTHSGAGRIDTIRMRPLSLYERFDLGPTVSLEELLGGTRSEMSVRSQLTLRDYADEIVRGGFPGMRHLDERALAVRLDSYVERTIDHDFAEAGLRVRRPETVRAWMRSYAAATATTASWDTIRDAATPGLHDKPARNTTAVYSDLLSSLRIIDPLEAWRPTYNHISRVGAAPKHHLADPALAARLLGRTRAHLLAGDEQTPVVRRDGSLFGGLFESLAALSVRTLAQSVGARVYHLRVDAGRHEIDLIVERAGTVLAIEVKLAATVDNKDVRDLKWLADAIGPNLADMVVITTGPEAYRRSDGVAVVPLGVLGP